MNGEAKNLFISHAHQDDAALQGLCDLLRRNGYNIRNSSIDSTKPNEATSEEYIKYKILKPRIDWAGTMLVLISPVTHTRPWVDWEIECAQRQGKRIVGVYVQGGQESNLPASFQMYGDALVGWQADRVMAALEGSLNTLFQSDNKTEFPERDIDRFTCGEPEPL
ncbi:TIR domain-containing protein [Corallococcus exercitus]|uniref:TIR domain-containing protein n=1 Tax=Corallococcus exercitus TaxID=2316736 RepID=A0A7Y4NQU0_9BACT|nr:TIR domain-containing protein [Corallococcus exercitus]